MITMVTGAGSGSCSVTRLMVNSSVRMHEGEAMVDFVEKIVIALVERPEDVRVRGVRGQGSGARSRFSSRSRCTQRTGASL